MDIQSLDIIVMNGRKYNLLHKLIQWRSLDISIHCGVMINENHFYDIDVSQMAISTLSEYAGRSIEIYRYNGTLTEDQIFVMSNWCKIRYATSKGYDWIQWIYGFVLGFLNPKLVNDETRWTCSEFCYWLFQDNGIKLTSINDVLPMPRLFRYSNHFKLVYSGIL